MDDLSSIYTLPHTWTRVEYASRPLRLCTAKPDNPGQGDTFVDSDQYIYVWFDGEWVMLGSTNDIHEQNRTITEEKTITPTNCCNCGAPLGGITYCLYCGTTNVKRRFAV